MKLRLTGFEWHLVRILFSTSIFIIGYQFLVPTLTIIHVIGLLLFTTGLSGLIVFIPFFLHDMQSAYPIKYRILQRFRFKGMNGNVYKYLPQVFKFKWMLIPMWCAINEKTHWYKQQNIFGAKSKEYFSTDKYNDEEEVARREIERHKNYATNNLRKGLFERPNRENNKIIKI